MTNVRRVALVAISFAIATWSLAGCKHRIPPAPTPMAAPGPVGDEAIERRSSTSGPTNVPTEVSPGVYEGVVTCGKPNRIRLTGTRTEVVRFDTVLSVPQFAASGANTSITLLDGETPATEGGNPVDIGGLAYPDTPIRGSRRYNFRHSGAYALAISVEQCVYVTYRVRVVREATAATNVSRDAAAPIAIDTPATGTFGCEEERWFAFDANERDRFRVTLDGSSRVTGSIGGASITLEAADGPLMENGNPVATDATFAAEHGTPATRDLTIPRAGRYYLHLAFWNGCVVSSYSVTLARR